MNEEVTCPFCKETGFDSVGLKYHLAHYCDKFQETPVSFTDNTGENVLYTQYKPFPSPDLTKLREAWQAFEHNMDTKKYRTVYICLIEAVKELLEEAKPL